MKRLLLGSLIIFSLFILPISVNADSNGLAGYWKFDEGSGASAFDSSGNGLTGTVSGATWVDGISGKALNFSGVNDYFTMPANSKLTFPNGNFTAELWFKLPQSYSGGSKMKWLLLKNGEYGLVLDMDGKLKFYISSNSGGYMSSVKSSWNANTWYHVVGVFENGNAWKIYINGNLDNSGSATYRTDRTDCSFDVGNFLGCQTAHDNFVGAIDEVKIYSRPLSASEILAEYQSFPQSSSSNSSSSSTTTNTSTGWGSTWCTNWANVGCGLSSCSSNQMKQTQKCGYSNSSGYSSEWENSQCVANETCNPTVCPMDVKQCPDGSYVSRNPNANCEFYPCLIKDPTWTNCTGASLIIISSKATSSSFEVVVKNVGSVALNNFTIIAVKADNSIYTNTQVGTFSSGSTSFISLFDITASACPLSKLRISVGNCPISIEMDNTTEKTKNICDWQSPSSQSEQAFLNACSGWAQTGCNRNNYNSSIEQAFKIWQPNVDLNNLPDGQNKIDYLASKCGCKQVQCAFANLDVKKADVSYDFSGVSSTANITVYNSGSEDLYNFSFGIITDKGFYTFNSMNQYSEAYPLAKGTATLFKTISSANNAPSSTETFKTLRITAICQKSDRKSYEVDMQATSSGSSSSISPIKEVDKTVLLDVLFGLEQVKIKLDGLKDSALAISEYYSGKGDTAKAGKWLEISDTFNGVINTIDGITAEIKQNKDNITADFIQKIKGEVGGVKADISSVIDKVIEVM